MLTLIQSHWVLLSRIMSHVLSHDEFQLSPGHIELWWVIMRQVFILTESQVTLSLRVSHQVTSQVKLCHVVTSILSHVGSFWVSSSHRFLLSSGLKVSGHCWVRDPRCLPLCSEKSGLFLKNLKTEQTKIFYKNVDNSGSFSRTFFCQFILIFLSLPFGGEEEILPKWKPLKKTIYILLLLLLMIL